MQATNNQCVMFYHGCDWNDTPARQRYLMAAMSEYLPVIFLDGTAERKGRISRYNPLDNVTVVKGAASLMVSMRRRGLEAAIGPMLMAGMGWVRRQYGRVLFWNSDNWLRPYRFIKHDALIYDCIDPCFSDNPEVVQSYTRNHDAVLRASNIVFATADSLVEDCARSHKRVVLLNNACAPEEYDPSKVAEAKKPEWWPKTDSPIAAYLGSLDWRFDFDLALDVCRSNPNIHFILAGKSLPEFDERVKALQALENVTCPGRISITDGRYLLANCSIGLILFTPGAMNDAINPVKMYAYALLGKPVVGTAIRELVSRPEIAMTARNVQEFGAALTHAIDLSRDPKAKQKLEEFARANTWQARAACAWNHIQQL